MSTTARTVTVIMIHAWVFAVRRACVPFSVERSQSQKPVNAANTDIAKKPITPPAADEVALDNIMKQVSPGFTALRASLDSSTTTTALEKAKELKGYFGDVQATFTKRNLSDAAGWAGEAQKLADTIGMAASAGKWDDAKTAATTLNGLCGTCHAARRERLDELAGLDRKRREIHRLGVHRLPAGFDPAEREDLFNDL